MATLRWRGKRAFLDWRENGKRKRLSLGEISEKDATLKLKAKEVELATGHRIIGTGLIFGNFVNDYLRWHGFTYPDSHDRIAQIVRDHLLPKFSHLPLEQIRKGLVEEYTLVRSEKGAKRATINKEVRTLKAILNRAIYLEYIDKNPLDGYKYLKELDSKPPRFYTKEELEQILCFSPYHWHWWRLMVNTGLRRKEALQIQPKRDIAGDSLRIISTEEERTKSAKWREVRLSESALYAIDRFRCKEKYLFPRVNPVSMSRAFAKCVARSPIDEPKGSIHCLRHTYCSHLVMSGVPLRTVQKLAGHASHTTTERYAHLSPDYLKGQVVNL